MSGTARMDIVAANSLCFALYTGILGPATLPLNLARFMFLDPRSRDFFLDWKPSQMTSPPPSAPKRAQPAGPVSEQPHW